MKWCFLCILLFSCHGDFANETSNNSGIKRVEDGSRFTEKDEPIDIVSTDRSKNKNSISLTLIGEISSPIISGDTLQATNIVLRGEKAFIGYNVKGDTFKGAADIIKLNKLISKGTVEYLSSVYFERSDVNCIEESGGKVYFALASDEGEFSDQAIAGYIRLKGNTFDLSDTKFVGLKGYAANSIHISGSSLLVTTGSNGGLYKLDKTSLEQESMIEIPYARWVDAKSNAIVLVSGGTTKGKLYFFENNSISAPVDSVEFSGSTQDQAKSTVKIAKEKIIVATNEGGIKVFDHASRVAVGEQAQIKLDGISSEKTVTNAVDGVSKYIYASNGEAGIYVYSVSPELKSKSTQTITFTQLGYLRFGESISANHIVYNSKFILVAAGKGGVKILSVDDDDDEEDD